MIAIKRVYEQPTSEDGFRILVDRLWPRGVSKENARIDLWVRELSPSNELRRWYQHDPDKWNEFKKRYFTELQEKKQSLDEFLQKISAKDVTFVFSSKELQWNNAVALKEFVESVLESKT